jgi:hypothetical protein
VFRQISNPRDTAKAGLTVRALIDEMAKLLVQQQNLTYWHSLFTYRTEFREAFAYRSEKE